MSFLFERLASGLEDRIRSSGGWAGPALYLGFKNDAAGFPAGRCRRASLLEGDSLSPVDGEHDMVIMNLQPAWLDHEQCFQLARSLLAPGGRLYFSSLGPDTLRELAEIWSESDDLPHVHAFVDIHQLGDALLRNGFHRPVLDADWMGVEYEDAELLMEDLRREGFHNIHPQRRKTLTGKGRLAGVRARLLGMTPFRTTFELLYGFATAAPEAPAAVRVNPPRAL